MERIGAMSIGTCLYLASLLGYVKVGNPGRHVFLRQGVAIQLRLTQTHPPASALIVLEELRVWLRKRRSVKEKTLEKICIENVNKRKISHDIHI
jgi:hypothetical protein